MYLDIALASVESEHHRQALLADAERYRLAAIARRARRAADRVAPRLVGTVPARGRAPAPATSPTAPPGPARAPVVAGAGKVDANCR